MLIKPATYASHALEHDGPYFGFDPTVVYIVRSRARNEEPRVVSRAADSLAPSLTFYGGEARVDRLWTETSDVLRRGYGPETADDQQALARAWERGWCLYDLSKQRTQRYGDTYRVYADGQQPSPEEEPLWQYLDLQQLRSGAQKAPEGQPYGPIRDTPNQAVRSDATPKVGSDHREIVLFDELVKHPQLAEASRQLFVDGHYARAVEEAIKALCGRVRERTGLSADGTSLMQTAFSEKKPRLRLNDLADQSERDEQIGHMQLFAGSITGLRNPRAHDHLYSDSPERALQLLIFADYLFSVVEAAAVESK